SVFGAVARAVLSGGRELDAEGASVRAARINLEAHARHAFAGGVVRLLARSGVAAGVVEIEADARPEHVGVVHSLDERGAARRADLLRRGVDRDVDRRAVGVVHSLALARGRARRAEAVAVLVERTGAPQHRRVDRDEAGSAERDRGTARTAA